MKQRHLFVVACCVCFVLFCLGCPEQLIKLFPNSPGQARQNTGQEVSIYRQNRTDCLSSFQYFTPPISILLEWIMFYLSWMMGRKADQDDSTTGDGTSPAFLYHRTPTKLSTKIFQDSAPKNVDEIRFQADTCDFLSQRTRQL